MQRSASLFLSLLLAFTPGLAVADVHPRAPAAMPARPFTQDFVSLFQSPAPRIIRDTPSSPAAIAVPRSTPALSTGTVAPGAVCRPALVAAEARYGIPTGLLQAIGVVESGRRDETTGARQPWPWTINAEGEPHFFDTKQQAITWVRKAQARGMQSIDVGCGQVNLMHHPDAFASLEEAFDPTTNADYAARFLRQLRDTTAGGNWMKAVGYYHSQTPELAAAYRQQVQAVTGNGIAPILPVPLFASAGQELPRGGMRPEPGRLLTAPAGTLGRGLNAYRAAPILTTAIFRPMPLTVRR